MRRRDGEVIIDEREREPRRGEDLRLIHTSERGGRAKVVFHGWVARSPSRISVFEIAYPADIGWVTWPT